VGPGRRELSRRVVLACGGGMLRVGGGFWRCLGVGGMLVGAFRGREGEPNLYNHRTSRMRRSSIGQSTSSHRQCWRGLGCWAFLGVH